MNEDTEALIGERAYDTFGRNASAAYGKSAEIKKRRSDFTTYAVMIAVGVTAVVFLLLFWTLYSSSFSSNSYRTKSIKDVDGEISWTDGGVTRPSYLKMDIYKHTSSITQGTYSDVTTKAKTYIAPLVATTDLGCGDTYKVVFDVKHIAGDNQHFTEFHFVDSSRFTQVGKSFGEWAEYVESLGTNTFNVYMHNKLQMFVPDAAPLYRKLQAANEFAFYHLTKSPGSMTYDVAHIGVPIPEATTIYEMVSPITNFADEELESFTPWKSNECADSNIIKKTLTEYQALYDDMTTTAREAAWTLSTGLYVPMAIAIFTPISSIDHFKAHAEASALIVDGTVTTEAVSGSCSMLTVDLEREEDGADGYNAVIKYIANSAAYEGSVFTLSDWEEEVEATHKYSLSTYDNGNYSSWNHYLDHHIGIITQPNTTDDDYCTDSKAYFEMVLDNYNIDFAPRMRRSTHFYSGVNGIRSWEFNVETCASTKYTWDICGCIASNNNQQYQAIHKELCTIKIATEPF